MEEIKVEIISREDIKLSSPTPSHPRTFKHSILDQVFPYPYTIIILFYTSHNLPEFPKTLELLKQSLSETLTQFYPLGGRIKDDFSIDCNDEGANFVVAKVNCPIAKILSKPDVYSLDKFLPISVSDHVTNIQVNVFDCGGIAIGLCISHRIFDADSLSTFLKVWTERTEKNCNLKPLTKPNFETISLFPTSTLHFRDVSKELWSSALKETKWITRRFLFTNSTIATLKAQILAKSSDDPLKNHPTRVQIVSVLLWKFFMAASKAQSGTQRPSLVTHAVNLRRRMDESLRPENSIGNFLWFSIAEHMDEHESSLDELVSKLKKSIQQVDKNLVARFQSDEEGSSIIEDGLRNRLSKTRVEALERLALNSWCNFGFYDADFGWGKPMWVSIIGLRGTSMYTNVITLIDTRFKDGIEAWVTLDDKKMKYFESCSELLTYAILDPSPLATGIYKV